MRGKEAEGLPVGEEARVGKAVGQGGEVGSEVPYMVGECNCGPCCETRG